MVDISTLNEISQIPFDRPIDFIIVGISFCYLAWLAWFIKNDNIR